MLKQICPYFSRGVEYFIPLIWKDLLQLRETSGFKQLAALWFTEGRIPPEQTTVPPAGVRDGLRFRELDCHTHMLPVGEADAQ
jgi:hypothetical protein